MAEPEKEPDQTPQAPAEPPPATQDPAPKPEPVPEPKPGPTVTETIAQIAEVLTIFNGTVIAPNMSVGNVGSAGEERPGRRRDGKLDDADIQATLRHYVTPDGYDGAVKTLANDRLVVIAGPPGGGKRTGALSLLRELTSATIVILSPAVTLKELAARTYEREYGYLAVDRQDEASSVDTDFTWRTVRDRVREAGAYLVITTRTARSTVETVRQIEWPRPDLRRVLQVRLVKAEVSDEVIDAVVTGLSDECSLSDVVTVANRIAADEDHETALAEYNRSAVRDVQDWFERKHSRHEILTVTALAFVEGSNHRTAESLRDRLQEVMARHIPPPEPAEDTKRTEETFDGDRMGQPAKDGLIRVDRINNGSIPRQTLVFRKPGYRRQVLVELWRRYPARFWDAVREWVEEIVTRRDSGMPAWGLAQLAAVDFEEVNVSFLEPWSDGAHGWRGQTAAIHVLWAMCFDESTAPIALRTTKSWANHGTAAQRWTAAVAFSGVLGVCYPTESTRQLWRLIAQSSDGEEDACLALSFLFATLVEDTEDAGRVIAMLDRQLKTLELRGESPERRRGLPRLRTLTMLAVLAVMSVRDTRSGSSSIFIYLNKNPDRVNVVARLWASLVRHRVYRLRALNALWTGLNSLRQISDNPTHDARVLGEALASSLPPDEHEPLRRHLTAVDTARRRGNSSAGSMAQVLLAALERFHQGSHQEGSL